jgi:hypothetical protein
MAPSVTAGAFSVLHHRSPHRELRQIEAMAPQEDRAPGAAGQQHRAGADGALLGHHHGNFAGLAFQSAGGTALMQAGAGPARSFGDRGCGQRRLGPAVAGRMQAADPFLAAIRRLRLGLGRAQQAAADLMPARVLQPALPAREFGGIAGQVENAVAPKPRIGPDLLLQPAPDRQALLDQGDLGLVAALLTTPAPIAARLLAGDAALLDQRDGDAAPRQEIGRRTADDAAADDDHIGAGGQLVIADDGIDGRGHGRTPKLAQGLAQGLAQCPPIVLPRSIEAAKLPYRRPAS